MGVAGRPGQEGPVSRPPVFFLLVVTAGWTTPQDTPAPLTDVNSSGDLLRSGNWFLFPPLL
jgi:hypothetical protein